MSLKEMKEIEDLKDVVEEAEKEKHNIFEEYNKAIAPALKIKTDAVSEEFKQYFTDNTFELKEDPQGIVARYKNIWFRLSKIGNNFQITDDKFKEIHISIIEQGKTNTQTKIRINPPTDVKGKLEERLKDIKEETEALKVKTTTAAQINFCYSFFSNASAFKGGTYNSFTDVLNDICK